MTFYWWSHWFWITVMSNLFFCSLIVVVQTYPSQDSSQEFNHHQTENTKKLVTKLYQTSTTSWSTESSLLGRTTTAEKTILQSVANSKSSHAVTTSAAALSSSPSSYTSTSLADQHTSERDGFEEYYYDQEDENQTKPIGLVEMEEELENKSHERPDSVPDEIENDIKRSAEHYSKSSESETKINLDLKSKELSSTTLSSLPLNEEKNNYTNFTDKITTSTNVTASNVTIHTSSTTSKPKNSDSNSDTLVAASSASASAAESDNLFSSAVAFESSPSSASSSSIMSMLTNNSTNNNVTISPHAPPATPKIVRTHHGSLEWLNSMADVAVSPPTAPVTTDINDERFPFTLENAHKSEDLRREESEPRTRKSKGLSAEYNKHGYASINYSSETKNLLTRSASTTVNEYETEESNISSEALSVQRSYLMDVGAISAICFTVFGICCTVGTIGIVLYRRRYLNKPQALSEPDSSVYIDDSTMRVSDNSDEMYSLDNDSFLNSLEAMTIQNYWTDTVKHTKL